MCTAPRQTDSDDTDGASTAATRTTTVLREHFEDQAEAAPAEVLEGLEAAIGQRRPQALHVRNRGNLRKVTLLMLWKENNR